MRKHNLLPKIEEVKERPASKFYFLIDELEEGDVRAFMKDPDQLER